MERRIAQLKSSTRSETPSLEDWASWEENMTIYTILELIPIAYLIAAIRRLK
jgi:hypothetical protein